jgi:hypothetical protein
MGNVKTTRRSRIIEVFQRYGTCLELVSMDPNFHDITVGLYTKNRIATLWTFSRKPGVEDRIREIRDQVIALGGLLPVEGTHDQASFPCPDVHERPVKFMLRRAVERPPDYSHPEGAISVKDLRSPLMLRLEGSEVDGRWVYRVDADGEAPNRSARLRAVTAGLVRYGEMEKVSDTEATFKCGYRHDELTRIVLPMARNVSKVEDMLAADALRSQMTTGTLGFTPPT